MKIVQSYSVHQTTVENPMTSNDLRAGPFSASIIHYGTSKGHSRERDTPERGTLQRETLKPERVTSERVTSERVTSERDSQHRTRERFR